MTVEHGGCERGCHLLWRRQRAVEHVVDRGIGDGGEEVCALVLGELVLAEGQELLGVAAVDTLADVGRVRPGR